MNVEELNLSDHPLNTDESSDYDIYEEELWDSSEEYKSVRRKMSELINKIRKVKNLTNKDLAEITGHTPNYVGVKLSQNNLSEEDMASICYELDIPFSLIVLMAEKVLIRDVLDFSEELVEILAYGETWLQEKLMGELLK